MRIYIASSNQHAVEMLTALLNGHTIFSFVENGETEGFIGKEEPGWYHTHWACSSDLVIYIPGDKDSAALIGIAWANNIPVLG